QLVTKGQIVRKQERRHVVQRSRQQRRRHATGAAARLQEGHLVEPLNFAADTQELIKVREIGTAAEQQMLAVVDNFSGPGMLVGGGAAAEVRAALEQRDPESDVGQRAARSETSQAATDDSHGLRRSFHHAMRSRKPRESTRSFSQKVRLTRSVRTS